MLTKAENELVPPQQAQLPKGGLSEQTAGSKAETTTKAEKPDRRKTHVPCSTIDRQMNARISATEMSARINLAGNGWWRNAKTADEKLGPDDI